jgi:hypothetical protein
MFTPRADGPRLLRESPRFSPVYHARMRCSSHSQENIIELLSIFRPQSRAIDQSDYRIAGGLFFIDTSFQVSNCVCRWSTANSPYKMAILKSRYLRKPADSAFGICKRRRRDWQSSSFKMRSAPARSLWTVSGARESQKSRQYSTKKASASSALAIHKHIGPLPCVANPFKRAPPMRAFYDDVNDF